MAKRQQNKLCKRAEQKIVDGHPLTPKERAAFQIYMESWMGPEIVGRLKKLGEAGKNR